MAPTKATKQSHSNYYQHDLKQKILRQKLWICSDIEETIRNVEEINQ
jgi:hypothetical protein